MFATNIWFLYITFSTYQRMLNCLAFANFAQPRPDRYLHQTNQISLVVWRIGACFKGAYICKGAMYEEETRLKFKRQPTEGQRCGICPTYFQKLCGFDFQTNQTYIFDNVCIMDLFNCIHGTEFIKLNYENCLYFGNFAYVHGLKHEDYDYGEDHMTVINSKKNPDFAL